MLSEKFALTRPSAASSARRRWGSFPGIAGRSPQRGLELSAKEVGAPPLLFGRHEPVVLPKGAHTPCFAWSPTTEQVDKRKPAAVPRRPAPRAIRLTTARRRAGGRPERDGRSAGDDDDSSAVATATLL